MTHVASTFLQLSIVRLEYLKRLSYEERTKCKSIPWFGKGVSAVRPLLRVRHRNRQTRMAHARGALLPRRLLSRRRLPRRRQVRLLMRTRARASFPPPPPGGISSPPSRFKKADQERGSRAPPSPAVLARGFSPGRRSQTTRGGGAPRTPLSRPPPALSPSLSRIRVFVQVGSDL